MEHNNSYERVKAISEKLLAFTLYLEKGITVVEKVYPQQKDFILENRHKTLTEIKQELIA